VGTKLDTSADIPYFDCAYKLMEYAGEPRLKKSEGKATWPGRKQVFRHCREGEMVRDILTLEGDRRDGVPLIKPFMRGGQRLGRPERLKDIRDHALRQIAALPGYLRDLDHMPPYPVEISPALERLKAEVEKKLG
jgi:nicotinate phosphoribosyltransferase